jgi:hypothetical protein
MAFHFTKAGYEAVAAKLSTAVGRTSTADEFTIISELAHGLADLFEVGNPRFDRKRFLRASGVSNGEEDLEEDEDDPPSISIPDPRPENCRIVKDEVSQTGEQT